MKKTLILSGFLLVILVIALFLFITSKQPDTERFPIHGSVIVSLQEQTQRNNNHTLIESSRPQEIKIYYYGGRDYADEDPILQVITKEKIDWKNTTFGTYDTYVEVPEGIKLVAYVDLGSFTIVNAKSEELKNVQVVWERKSGNTISSSLNLKKEESYVNGLLLSFYDLTAEYDSSPLNESEKEWLNERFGNTAKNIMRSLPKDPEERLTKILIADWNLEVGFSEYHVFALGHCIERTQTLLDNHKVSFYTHDYLANQSFTSAKEFYNNNKDFDYFLDENLNSSNILKEITYVTSRTNQFTTQERNCEDAEKQFSNSFEFQKPQFNKKISIFIFWTILLLLFGIMLGFLLSRKINRSIRNLRPKLTKHFKLMTLKVDFVTFEDTKDFLWAVGILGAAYIALIQTQTFDLQTNGLIALILMVGAITWHIFFVKLFKWGKKALTLQALFLFLSIVVFFFGSTIYKGVVLIIRIVVHLIIWFVQNLKF